MPDQSLMTEPKSALRPALRTRGFLSGISELASREQQRIRENFTREQVIHHLKTLAWVIPITLLIWVYAEREQIAMYKDQPLPFELVSLDPNRHISLSTPMDRNLMVDLQGPQARVQGVLQRLRGGLSPQGLKIEINPTLTAGRMHEIGTVDLLQSQRVFRDNGITVVSAHPSRLMIMIDEVVEREAQIAAHPDVKNLEATSSFDPPAVVVRGPASLIEEAMEKHGRLVVYAEIPSEVLNTPGHHDLPDVGLTRPAPLLDPRVSYVNGNRVRASLDVRAADVTRLIPSMPVMVVAPDALWDRYRIDKAVFKPVIQNVRVIGPEKVVEAMLSPDFSPKPEAHLKVTMDDVGEIKSRIVTYANLPRGVEVSEDDQKRTVEFRLIERTGTD